ncbi:pyridoxamine 5'-phosphate oxidase family protein [Actinophytocola glycyrrhizae]|uniref:Pyridoxamine 5'-phosphate oxidase family protein n=1 Tax=Actinophytocola glycyrrhizae TaxID=2044873 RepID=A0ABV9S7Y9_9PSEU
MTVSLATRTRRLLDEARYLSLATVSTNEQPWSAVLQYAWLADPLRFLFGSAVQSRHSNDIATRPLVSGSLFVAGGELMAVDGAQFTGVCRELTTAEVQRYHGTFYDAVLPDARDRAEWTLPPSALVAPAPHRLYLVEVEQWWLVDTRTWAEDRIDRRVEVPLTELTGFQPTDAMP